MSVAACSAVSDLGTEVGYLSLTQRSQVAAQSGDAARENFLPLSRGTTMHALRT
jgi:hypothetical protein